MVVRNFLSALNLSLLGASCAVFLAFGVGCGRSETSTPVATVAPKANTPHGPRGCLYIVLDAFDAGHVSHLGYPRETTPVLDALARRGVSFTRAYSQCPNTLGSTQSLMSGRYLPAPLPGDLPYVLGASTPLLAEAFRAVGYRTSAFSENPWIRENTGFARGFDDFKSYEPLLPKVQGHPSRKRDEAITTKVLADAERWILDRETGGWFCYLHVLRPHDPYLAPEPYGERFLADPSAADTPERDVDLMFRTRWRNYRPSTEEVQYVTDLYDGSIAYIDALVGGFLDRLTTAGRLEDALVIVTSDHGEAFMQHGSFKHGNTVFEEMIHVPFVMVPPSGTDWPIGLRNQTIELVDVFPTLANLFGFAAPPSLDGGSFVEALRAPSRADTGTVYSQTLKGDRIAYRRGDTKFVFSQKGPGFSPDECYDLFADPGEKSNLCGIGSPPADLVAEGLAAIEDYFRAPEAAAGTLDAEQAEALKALGYVKE